MARNKFSTPEALERHRLYNRLYMRRYRKTCRDKVRTYKMLLRRKRGAKERKKLSLNENRRRQAISTKKWRKLNPEKWKLIQSAHNHRRRAAIGRWTSQKLLEKFSYYKNRCFYCGRGDVKLTADHFIPLSRKPLNWLSNIRPACFPCNLKKGAK